jgi:hypothetical protein
MPYEFLHEFRNIIILILHDRWQQSHAVHYDNRTLFT